MRKPDAAKPNAAGYIRWVTDRWPELTDDELCRVLRVKSSQVQSALILRHNARRKSYGPPPWWPPDLAPGTPVERVRAAFATSPLVTIVTPGVAAAAADADLTPAQFVRLAVEAFTRMAPETVKGVAEYYRPEGWL